MNKFLLILFFLVLACNKPQTSVKEYILLDPFTYEKDTFFYLPQDSILKIADKAMRDLNIKEGLRKNMIFQIQQQIKNEELTKQQIQILQQQSQSYEVQIQEYHRRRVVRKDSVIYNIIYKDTVICRPVYISDTIYVEVLDTIKVKKLKRKRKHHD